MRSGVGAGSGSFGARLLAGRLAVGLSQEELAGSSGLSVRAIRMLERGKTRWPHPDTVRRLADALRLDGDARAGFVAAADRRLGRNGPGAEAGPTGGGAFGGDAGLEVPRQLPAPLAAFVGRDGELASVTGMAREQSAVIVVSGMAGAGKTALALRWAHDVVGRFPDGQLHADLRGFGPSGAAADPAAVLRGFLAAFGVPNGRVPTGAEEAAGLYRSVLAGRRVLVFLDNARDEEQVRPLLPGSAASVALVTSRRHLTGLLAREGAGAVLVGLLSVPQAQELIARRVGYARAAAEPGAVAELAGLCGRLPLALAVIAARAVDRPGVPLAALAAELRGNACLLEALEADDADVPAADGCPGP